MKIIHVVGARPQFIKYFPVSRALAVREIEDILVHTGQHYDYSMSRVFFDEFGIKEPEYHLGVGSGTHAVQTAKIMEKVEAVLEEEAPDAVMVYGDTNSTLGGALAASKIHVPVAHVEAGLRSHKKRMAEEVNRILTDNVSTLLLCPSKTAVDNLRCEGFANVLDGGGLVPADRTIDERPEVDNPLIVNVGDVMYDVLLYSVEIAGVKSGILRKLGLSAGEYSLCTVHRAENTDDAETFGKIVDFVNKASGGKKVLLPMHPRTRKVYSVTGKKFAGNIQTIDPVGYFDILMLLKNGSLLMTDSGGMQKEAYWLGVPCVTLRDETEWIETVRSGWNILYKDYRGFHRPSDGAAGYGDGSAAARIANVLLESFGKW